jgi:hypothetical protein
MLSTPVKFADDLELVGAPMNCARSGRPIRLSRIPMELLFLVVERRGELVTRDEIVARIWGKDVFLDTDTKGKLSERPFCAVDSLRLLPRHRRRLSGGYFWLTPSLLTRATGGVTIGRCGSLIC